jgi:hypothetical protein
LDQIKLLLPESFGGHSRPLIVFEA